MLKDSRCTCTGAGCKVCLHLGRQRAARAAKRGAERARRDPWPAPAPSLPPSADHPAGG
jgi:hypothetical protein